MASSHVDAKTILPRIGVEVRRRRMQIGMSQVLLATKAAVHRNVIGRLERGMYNPTILVLSGISKALNTSLAELLQVALK
jgi:transcriptional regulator with XRE-family HTH domain